MSRRGGTVTLTRGFRAIRVESFEKTGDPGLIPSRSGPGIAGQVVPAANLYH